MKVSVYEKLPEQRCDVILSVDLESRKVDLQEKTKGLNPKKKYR